MNKDDNLLPMILITLLGFALALSTALQGSDIAELQKAVTELQLEIE